MVTINEKFGFQKEKDMEDWLYALYSKCPDFLCDSPSGVRFYFFHLYDEKGNDHGRITIEDMVENAPFIAKQYFTYGNILPAYEQMPSREEVQQLIMENKLEEIPNILHELNRMYGIFGTGQ